MKKSSKTAKSIDSPATMLGLTFFGKSRAELLKIIKNRLLSDNGLTTVFTPNPEQVVLAAKDDSFYAYLKTADLLLPDGVGVVLATKLKKFFGKGEACIERIPGRLVAKELLDFAQKNSLQALVIGGRGYELLENSSVSWMSGYENISKPTADEEKRVISKLKDLQPKLVFISFGAPYQEQWVVEHRDVLRESGVRLCMVVGGSFDTLLGRVKAPPTLVVRIGLEWLWRLIQEPWRWRRQLRLFSFVKVVLKELVTKDKIPVFPMSSKTEDAGKFFDSVERK